MNQVVAKGAKITAEGADGRGVRVRFQAADPRLACFKQSGHVPLGQPRLCPQASELGLLGHRRCSFHRSERGDVPKMGPCLPVEDKLGGSDATDIEFVRNIAYNGFHPRLGRIFVPVQDEEEI